MKRSIPWCFGAEWNLGRCFGNQGGCRSAGSLTVAPQCLRRSQRAQSEVFCLGVPGPDHVVNPHQQCPPWLQQCRWFGLSSAERGPAGLRSAAGSGPESGPSSAGAAGSGSFLSSPLAHLHLETLVLGRGSDSQQTHQWLVTGPPGSKGPAAPALM